MGKQTSKPALAQGKDPKTASRVLVQVGLALKKAREAQSLTQLYVAEALAVDKSHISKIENGHGNPSLETFLRWCTAIDTPASIVLRDIRLESRLDS